MIAVSSFPTIKEVTLGHVTTTFINNVPVVSSNQIDKAIQNSIRAVEILA